MDARAVYKRFMMGLTWVVKPLIILGNSKAGSHSSPEMTKSGPLKMICAIRSVLVFRALSLVKIRLRPRFLVTSAGVLRSSFILGE